MVLGLKYGNTTAENKAAKAKTKAQAEHWQQWAKQMEDWAANYKTWADSDEFKRWQKDVERWAQDLAKLKLKVRGDEPGPVPELGPMPVMPLMPSMPMPVAPAAPVPPDVVLPDVVDIVRNFPLIGGAADAAFHQG